MNRSFQPRRLLMTLDAVGGVWRYAMDLGAALAAGGTEIVFACFGPAPSAAQLEEAASIGAFHRIDAPLDWTASGRADLDKVPSLIADLVAQNGADLIHLNLPSQAAGLRTDVPVVVVSHSCVVTWFKAVRGYDVPADWSWQRELNQAGFNAADAVVAPSRSHADLLAACYRELAPVHVVYNAVRPIAPSGESEPFIIAAGRWWDDGKNAAVLDQAAAWTAWPVRMAGAQHGPNGQYRAIQHATFLGELSGGEVRSLISRASILASPSVYEPFGLAPLEAASAGLPLVLSNIPTYRELWDGAALFAAADDSQAFSSLLNQLIADPALRAEYGARSQKRSFRFTPAAQLAGMQSVYAEAMSRHAAVPIRATA